MQISLASITKQVSKE